MNITNPKELILNILLAAGEEELSTKEAIAACSLFGIQANSVRVTLARLNAAGLIEAAGRGSYRLGAQASDLARELGVWKTAESQLKPWAGGWIMVYTGELGRRDRPALTKRLRALSLLGFQALEREIHIRPNNLQADLSGIRNRLQRLGLEKEALILLAQALETSTEARARQLWDGLELNQTYQQCREQLEKWLTHYDQLDMESAAREAFLLGNAAIRKMVYDPLLPEPLVDVQARKACLDAVKHFDQVGHDIWRKLRASRNG